MRCDYRSGGRRSRKISPRRRSTEGMLENKGSGKIIGRDWEGIGCRVETYEDPCVCARARVSSSI